MSKTIDKWAFETAADAVGAEITEDYSGRGMYGDQCIGFTADDNGVAAEFFIELADITDAETAKSLARSERTDSMGMGVIHYFPNWTFGEGRFEGRDEVEED